MITEEEYLKALEVVKAYQKQINNQVKELVPFADLPETLEDLDLSVRTFNSIQLLFNKHKSFRGLPLRDMLEIITRKNLREIKGFGPASEKELEQALAIYGINLS